MENLKQGSDLLLRELALAGARRVSLSSRALYSAGMYIPLVSVCLPSLPLSFSVCFHVYFSPLYVFISFFLFLP